MEVDNWSHPPKACSVFQASELIEPLLKQVIAQQIRQRGIAIHEALFLLLKTEISDCRKLGPMPRDPRLWRDHSGTHNLKPEERACATGQYHPYDDEALQE